MAAMNRADLKPGVRSYLESSTLVEGPMNLWLPLLLFLAISRELELEVEQLELEPMSIWNVSAAVRGLVGYAITTTALLFLKQ